MELLPNDERVVSDEASVSTSTDDAHGYLVSGVPCSSEGAARLLHSDATVDDTLLSTAESEGDDAASFHPLPLRTPLRRKIGKNLQLALLRKYVQCAKDLTCIPDRATTERVLDQAYDEFYFNGGDVNEPRMGYAAFIKLVRNRRGEVTRMERVGESRVSHQKKYANERKEIRALVMELERVRSSARQQRHTQTAEITRAGEPSRAPGTSSHSGTMTTTTTVHLPTTTPTIINGDEHVLVSKRKLELVLQSAQETLATQAKLLDQVHALERQLTEMQRLQYPLGH